MSQPIIHFIDDQETQRRGLEWDLRDLFGKEYHVSALPLHKRKDDYHGYLDDPDVLGLLIDQQLNESGLVTGFTGIDLAKHLRGIYPEMPIYLVTGYDPDDQIKGADSGSVEAVITKSELRANSPDALRFKQRFLRQAKRYQEALCESQRRFRELLSKSLNGTITEAEAQELAQLETSRLLPTQAAEEAQLGQVKKQIEAIETLQRLLNELEEKGKEQ